MAPRTVPERTARAAIMASWLADRVMTDDDLADLVAQAAVADARKIMPAQHQPPRAQPPRTTAAAAPATPPPPAGPAPPPPPIQPPTARYRIRNRQADHPALVQPGRVPIGGAADTRQAGKNAARNGTPGRD
ncbi:MAG TPA: hypothetical protein VF897_09590 [Roseiflexaceae bacterium]